MKINLSTKLMKGIVTKMISKAIFNKFGYEVNIQINDLQLENHGGKIHIHADVDGEVDNEEFVKIIKSVGLD